MLSALDDRNVDLARFQQYWEGKRHGAHLPARADIDPTEFPYLLGCVSLIEVLGDPARFRVRLYGSCIAALTGRDWTGRLLAEEDAEQGPCRSADCEAAVASRRPFWTVGRLPRTASCEPLSAYLMRAANTGGGVAGPRTAFWFYEGLYLPLGAADGGVGTLLAAFRFRPEQEKTA